jgi:hypothetical protein
MLKIRNLLFVTLLLITYSPILFGNEPTISDACLQEIKQNCPELKLDQEADDLEFLKLLVYNPTALKLCIFLRCVNQLQEPHA